MRVRLLGAALAMGVAAIVAAPVALAAPPSWTQLTAPPLPSGSHAVVWKVAADPTNPQQLLAATSRGLYASSDGGQSWTATAVTAWTWSVAYAPGGGTAYAATETHGVYRSTGGGWSSDNLGLSNLDVRAIAVSSDAVLVGTNSGVYVSGTGVGWEPAGLQGTSISSVAITGTNPLAALAGSDGKIASGNLFSNGALATSKSWQTVTGADPGGAPVFAIGVGPLARGASSAPILVGNLKGLFLSTNGGAAWQQVSLANGALWTVNTIAFDPENPAVVYVGGDNGGSSGGGLQRSINGGSAWAPYQQGLPGSDVTGLFVEPTSPVTVLAGVWKASDRVAFASKLVDTGAPGPVPLQAVGAVSPIPISPPPTTPPTPAPTPVTHPSTGSGFSVPSWLPPLVAAVVLVALTGTIMGLRRRRNRLDAEAPP